MAQYSGKVDDYLQVTSGALEVATDTLVLPIYDPESNEIKWFKIDVSERGSKEVKKLLAKTTEALKNGQTELLKLVERIEANGGGTMLQRRPKVAAPKQDDPAPVGVDAPEASPANNYTANSNSGESPAVSTGGEQPVAATYN